jgi:hypothetical protein
VAGLTLIKFWKARRGYGGMGKFRGFTHTLKQHEPD